MVSRLLLYAMLLMLLLHCVAARHTDNDDSTDRDNDDNDNDSDNSRSDNYNNRSDNDNSRSDNDNSRSDNDDDRSEGNHSDHETGHGPIMYYSAKRGGFVLDADGMSERARRRVDRMLRERRQQDSTGHCPYTLHSHAHTRQYIAQQNSCKRRVMSNYPYMLGEPSLRRRFLRDLQRQMPEDVDANCPRSAVTLTARDRAILLGDPRFRAELSLLMAYQRVQARQREAARQRRERAARLDEIRERNVRPANVLTVSQQLVPADLLN